MHVEVAFLNTDIRVCIQCMSQVVRVPITHLKRENEMLL